MSEYKVTDTSESGNKTFYHVVRDEDVAMSKCLRDCYYNVGGTCKYLEFDNPDSNEMQCEHPLLELSYE